MASIRKILLPVEFPNTSLDVLHQSVLLAGHFKAQIVMLHVVTATSHAADIPYPGQEPPGWDLLARILQDAQKQQDQSLASELHGIPIQCLLTGGDPARTILRTAQTENTDLIMMSSHGFIFDQFLLDSVTATVLQTAPQPIWTGAHIEESPSHPFSIRKVLCAVDLGPRSDDAISWASEIATEFSARLTLAHVTAGVELWGPGGWHVDQEWKEALVSDASQRIAKLESETGIKAEVFIGSGDVPKVLSQAAKQANADLLVNGCYPYGGNLRTQVYGIISAVPIPILSV